MQALKSQLKEERAEALKEKRYRVDDEDAVRRIFNLFRTKEAYTLKVRFISIIITPVVIATSSGIYLLYSLWAPANSRLLCYPHPDLCLGSSHSLIRSLSRLFA